jgi:hypothetical protein
VPALADPWFEAEFYGNVRDGGGVHRTSRQGASIDGAQGLVLYCPCGFGKAPEVVHGLWVPFANPRNAPSLPPDHGPIARDKVTHPRWTMTGTGLADLTLTPSIDVGADSCWHGFITAGQVL